MIKLKTANGKMFEIAWIGVSNIDGVLRFSVVDPDVTDVFQTFMIPENCIVLTRIFDEDEQVFEGYKIFRGVQINFDGSAIISLSKI